jgi:hypothetical protein
MQAELLGQGTEFRLRHHNDALEADAHRRLAGAALERQRSHHHFLGGRDIEDRVRRSLGIEEGGTGAGVNS